MRLRRFLASATGAAVVSTAALAGVSSTPASSAPAPILLGQITTKTGLFASSFMGAEWGAEARIDAQNAAGGVNGHKLKLTTLDDQSSGTGNLTAAKQLVQSDKVFGVIEDTLDTYGASVYLNQQGVPVTGVSGDGDEWGLPQNKNMFGVTGPPTAPINGKNYTYTTTAVFLKKLGVTKLAGASLNFPSAITALRSAFQTGADVGVKNCYENTAVPFGSADFTADALAIKSAGCNGFTGIALLATDVAISTQFKESGINIPQFYSNAYDQSVLADPATTQALQGIYASAYGNPAGPATQKMIANLKKYTPFPGGVVGVNVVQGYEAADLMILGLEGAGKNPTRPAFIKALRKVGNYTANGLLASPLTFQHFGTLGMLPKTSCSYIVQLKGKKFVTYNNGQPICGKLVSYNPGS